MVARQGGAIMSADPDDKPVPRFRRSDEFSRFGVEPKVWFRAPENKTLAAQCASVFGDVKPRIGTIVLRYETDDKGTILANAGYKLTALITNVEKVPKTIQNLIRGGWNLCRSRPSHILWSRCGRQTMAAPHFHASAGKLLAESPGGFSSADHRRGGSSIQRRSVQEIREGPA